VSLDLAQELNQTIMTMLIENQSNEKVNLKRITCLSPSWKMKSIFQNTHSLNPFQSFYCFFILNPIEHLKNHELTTKLSGILGNALLGNPVSSTTLCKPIELYFSAQVEQF
jgi:hypothetical protein